MAGRIFQRIQELLAGFTVEELVKYSVGRCHALQGERHGEYAMDLIHPYRLIFRKKEEILEVVVIVSIEDYH